MDFLVQIHQVFDGLEVVWVRLQEFQRNDVRLEDQTLFLNYLSVKEHSQFLHYFQVLLKRIQKRDIIGDAVNGALEEFFQLLDQTGEKFLVLLVFEEYHGEQDFNQHEQAV